MENLANELLRKHIKKMGKGITPKELQELSNKALDAKKAFEAGGK